MNCCNAIPRKMRVLHLQDDDTVTHFPQKTIIYIHLGSFFPKNVQRKPISKRVVRFKTRSQRFENHYTVMNGRRLYSLINLDYSPLHGLNLI
ncbi:hypothetical protein CEXT_551551 [Caerostris extrusa]|uniref:Uncharacterized protein n=1 Tax=Caerostris extrusa TaxID=172846 RepID=A0AAV4STS9_CAEEX|nr:hypothetical protein CEXT_551551 [Caerostris extrusa]